MIDFELTDKQKQWQKKAKDFAEKEIKPLAWKIDRGLAGDYLDPFLKIMAEEGFLALGVPEEYGGAGLDKMTTMIVLEELAVADIGIAFMIGLNALPAVLVFGTEEQKKKFLPFSCDRKKPGLVALGLTEAGAGSDIVALTATARRDGDEYVLNGEKCFISNGDVAAIYQMVATLDKSKGVKGITGFLVPGDTKGLSTGKIEDKMGFRSSHTSVVVLNDVRVPAENRLGEEGEGFYQAARKVQIARVFSCGAMGVGLARAAYETTLKFLKSYSNVKALMTQQAIAFDLADMLASIEASRLLAWKSCLMLDKKDPLALTFSALTKVFCSDVTLQIANKAMQLVGLRAYSEEYPIEKYVRDAKLLQIYEGTNQINRMVASGEILRR